LTTLILGFPRVMRPGKRGYRSERHVNKSWKFVFVRIRYTLPLPFFIPARNRGSDTASEGGTPRCLSALVNFR